MQDVEIEHSDPFPESVLVPPPAADDTMPPRLPRPGSAEVALRHSAATIRRRVEQEGTPLVDPVGGRSDQVVVTFAWLATEPVDAVRLVANKLVDLTDPNEGQLRRLDEDTWAASYLVAADWRCSYLLSPSPGVTVRDPHNPNRIASKWDVGDMSLAAMPNSEHVTGWQRGEGVATGRFVPLDESRTVLGADREVWLATSAGPPPERVLVLLDGEVWAQVLPIMGLLDNMVASGEIPPTAVVMPHSLGPARREQEMACNPRFVDGLTELARIAARSSGAPFEPRTTAIAGQSLGGLTAAFATLSRPEVFGAALCQSPSLWWPNRAGAEQWLTGAFARAIPAERRLAVHVGTDEWVLLEPTRRFCDVLGGVAGTTLVDYVEFSGGHDHACWQAQMRRGLAAVLGT